MYIPLVPSTPAPTKLRAVSRGQPCPVCGGDHKCSRGEDGLLVCGRPPGQVPGFRFLGLCQGDPQFGLYRREDDLPAPPSTPGIDWQSRAQEYAQALTPPGRRELADHLGLPEAVLERLAVGFRADDPHGPCWTFPESDGSGRVIGLQRRYPNGEKRAMADSRRGLVAPRGWQQLPGPVFLPEGASDTLTLTALNLAAVGRPANTGGVELLAELLRPLPPDRQLVVLGEYDPKPDGRWPGRDGAVRTAEDLARKLDRPVSWALPPDGCKDVRAWLLARKPDPTCADQWHDLGEQLLAGLTPVACGTGLLVRAEPGKVAIPANAWEAPVPLLETMPALSFPVDVLPRGLATFVREAAAALDCPADYLGAPLMALAGSAIGASRALRVKDNWYERPALYLAMVGPPGSTKSPALKVVAEPIYEAQNRLLAEHQARLAQYEARMAAYEPPKKGVLGMPWEQEELARHAKPVRPVLVRLFAADTTIEALAPLLLENPRGLPLIRDEVSAWVMSMNQYKAGRGSDRQFFLAAWAGEPICVDRKGQDRLPLMVAHPFLTIVGGLTTDMLMSLREAHGWADGFLDRILFAYPDAFRLGNWNRNAIAEASLAAWRDVLNGLWALQPETGSQGRPRPHVVGLTPEGEAEWATFFNALAGEINAADFPEHLRGPWTKLKGYAARLALIVHCLRRATQEVDSEDVDAESVGRAVRLVDYFKGHARKAYASMQTDPVLAKAAYLLRWIHRNVEAGQTFRRSEAYLGVRRQFQSPDELDRPLQILCDLRHIRPVAGAPREGGGRPPSPLFAVNPQSCSLCSLNARNSAGGGFEHLENIKNTFAGTP